VTPNLTPEDSANLKQKLLEQAPTMDWDTLLTEICLWQRRTFENYTPESSLAHLVKETDEIRREPYDMEEWADGMFLLLQGADRVSQITGESLLNYMRLKFVKNLNREWHEPDAEGVILHKEE
jgi:hypothetical protein